MENTVTIEQMVAEIDKVKTKWLKKEIKLTNLTDELDHVICRFKQQQHYTGLVKYIENVVLLDGNVENSTSIIGNTCLSLVPILLSINASVLALNEDKAMAIVFALISIIFSIGLGFIAFSILKKHAGKYAREKSFYEILIKMM